MIASNRCKQSEEKAESPQVLSAVSLAVFSSWGKVSKKKSFNNLNCLVTILYIKNIVFFKSHQKGYDATPSSSYTHGIIIVFLLQKTEKQ